MNIAAAANETLAHNSNLLVYSAMAVYTLAFLAHMAEWVFGSRSKVGRTAAALTAQAKATATVSVHKAQQGGERPSWNGPRSSPSPSSAAVTSPTGRAPRATPRRATSTGGSPSR